MAITTTRPPRRPGRGPAPAPGDVLGDDEHILNLEPAPVAGPAPEPVPRRVRHLIVLPGGGGGAGDAHPGDAHPGRDARAVPAPASRQEPRRRDRPARRRWRRRKAAARASEAAQSLPLSHVRTSEPVPAAPSGAGPGAQVSMSAVGGAQAQLAVETLPVEVPAPSFKLRLKVISRSVTASRTPGMPFVVLASILISVAVLGMVVLHVMVDQYSFRVDSLQTKVNTLQASLGQLSYQVSVAEAPQRVAAAAGQLGMTPATQIRVITGPGPGTRAASTASSVTGTVKAGH